MDAHGEMQGMLEAAAKSKGYVAPSFYSVEDWQPLLYQSAVDPLVEPVLEKHGKGNRATNMERLRCEKPFVWWGETTGHHRPPAEAEE